MDFERFKPTTLGECILELMKKITYKDLLDIRDMKDEGEVIGVAHFAGGRYMRNNWGMWDENSPLHKFFEGIGIKHADDMSGIVYRALHRVLNGKNIDMEGLVKHYQDFWKIQGFTNGIPN